MVIDSPAVVAIPMQEREGPAFIEALVSDRTAVIGAPSLFEVQTALLRIPPQNPDTGESGGGNGPAADGRRPGVSGMS